MYMLCGFKTWKWKVILNECAHYYSYTLLCKLFKTYSDLYSEVDVKKGLENLQNTITQIDNVSQKATVNIGGIRYEISFN